MGYFEWSASFHSGDAISSTANDSFPDDNTEIYTRPYRVWKATAVSTATYIGADLGSAKAVYGVFVDNINVSSVIFEASDAANFTPLIVAGNTVTVNRDEADDRYKYFLSGGGAALATARYWRVRSAVASTTDGASVMTCGTFLCLSGLNTTTADTGFSFPYTVAPRKSEVNGVVAGTGACDITISYPTTTHSTVPTILDFAQKYRGKPWLFFRNYTSDNTEEAYMVRTLGDVSVSYSGVSAASVSNLVLREYGSEVI